jgi:hypothetical protein
MTDAASLSFFRSAPAPQRLALALAVSAAIHLCLGTRLLAPAPRPAPVAGYTIAARLALEEAAPVRSQLPHAPPAARPRELQKRPASGATTDRTPTAIAASEALFYPAVDLDVFPLPLEPLRLQGLQHVPGNAAGIRAIVKIDEHGSVRDVEIAGTGRQAQERLRELLGAARFAPGRKDGRAVSSRIVLDIRVADY